MSLTLLMSNTEYDFYSYLLRVEKRKMCNRVNEEQGQWALEILGSKLSQVLALTEEPGNGNCNTHSCGKWKWTRKIDISYCFLNPSGGIGPFHPKKPLRSLRG